LNLGSIQSINQILQATFQILTYEKVGVTIKEAQQFNYWFHSQQRQPEMLGASVFGPNDIYPRLKAYKAKLLEDHPSGIL
jgi:telomerase reverse transcriptase